MHDFFVLLKQEIFYRKTYEYFKQLESTIHEYVNFYINTRIKIKLKGLSST
ncbi:MULTISPECIES: IS3 family transposase [Staphylococcus]|uniref:Integrase catalytic domain-containing protein n=1 Tax=Staphylococcus argensis TaxID=1607738 RepID=A0A2K4FDQ6_9STAP|nr:hypothetical protein CD039_01680 [Staphylococcus argensis]